MAPKSKRLRRNRPAYLTKRILVNAARKGVSKAARETMDVMGYVIEAQNGWVVKMFPDGTIIRISPIQPSENRRIVLD